MYDAHQAALCARTGCSDVRELADLIGHDPLGHRVILALTRADVATAERLAAMTDQELLKLKNLGSTGLTRIRGRIPPPGQSGG